MVVVVGTHRKYGSKKSESDHSYRMCVSSMNRQTHDFMISSSSLLLSITSQLWYYLCITSQCIANSSKCHGGGVSSFHWTDVNMQTHSQQLFTELLYLSFQLNYWLQLDFIITARVIDSLLSIGTCFSDFIFIYIL